MMNATGYKSPQRSNSIRPRRKAESGQSLVELGILAPVLVFVLVGVVDFGRIFMVEQVITNAAREGARVAVVDTSSTLASQTVQSYMQGAGLDMSQATITITGANAATGQPTVVAITYKVTSLALQLVHANSNITLSATSSMLHE